MKSGLIIIQLMIYCFFTTVFSGCGNDQEDIDIPSGENIQFNIGFAPQARMLTDNNFNSSFENKDEIGIFAVKTGESLQTTDNYIHNLKVAYDGSLWTPEKKIYYPAGYSLDFYAYYPYSKNIDPVNITYNASSQSYDLLAAKSTGQSQKVVSLYFSHKLSLIQVEIEEETENNPAQVVIKNLKSRGNLNLESDIFTVHDNVEDIPINRNNNIHRLYIPAQAVSIGDLLFDFRFKDNSYNYYTDEDIKLEEGKAKPFKFKLYIPDINIDSSIPGEIINILE